MLPDTEEKTTHHYVKMMIDDLGLGVLRMSQSTFRTIDKRTTPEEKASNIYIDWEKAKGFFPAKRNNPYAVNCGLQRNGRYLVVVDIDEGKECKGFEDLKVLEDQHGPLPDTLAVETPRGGQHLYYWADTEIPSTAKQVAKSIDIRACGGITYGIGTYRDPRPDKEGGYYSLEVDMPIADLPEKWVGLCKAAKKDKSPAGSVISNVLPFDPKIEKVPQGSRNDFLYRYACKNRGRGMSENEIFALVQAKNLDTCEPPINDIKELRSIASSACTHAAGSNAYEEMMSAVVKRQKKTNQKTIEWGGQDAISKVLAVIEALPARDSEDFDAELWWETVDAFGRGDKVTPKEEESIITAFLKKAPERIGSRALKKQLKHVRDEKIKSIGGNKTDVNNEIVKYLIKNAFEAVYYISRGWWVYTGTHIEHVDENYIHAVMVDHLEKLLNTEDPELEEMSDYIYDKGFPAMLKQLTPLMKAAFKITDGDDVLELCQHSTRSYMNFKNGTLWLSKEGYEFQKDHNPEDKIMSCIDHPWDPIKQETPEWDRLCRLVFPKDTEDMQRHLEEVIGYILQNTRNLKAWFYLVGPTNALKTSVTGILTSLIRRGVVAREFKDVDSDTHAKFGLIGKQLLIEDDWPKNAAIPDGFLKKIAEEKILTGNPKGEKTLNFIAKVAPMICSNFYVKTSDTSRAVHDRAVVIPLAAVDAEQRSTEGKQRLMAEVPKMIPKFVEGAIRVFKRDGWDHPGECLKALSEWTAGSTTIDSYINDNVEVGVEGEHLSLGVAYTDYKQWHQDNNPGGRPMGKNTFGSNMDGVLGARTALDGRRNLWKKCTLKSQVGILKIVDLKLGEEKKEDDK